MSGSSRQRVKMKKHLISIDADIRFRLNVRVFRKLLPGLSKKMAGEQKMKTQVGCRVEASCHADIDPKVLTNKNPED